MDLGNIIKADMSEEPQSQVNISKAKQFKRKKKKYMKVTLCCHLITTLELYLPVGNYQFGFLLSILIAFVFGLHFDKCSLLKGALCKNHRGLSEERIC